MIIGVRLKNSEEARGFIKATNERMNKGYSFHGGAVSKQDKGFLFCLFVMDAVFPSLSLIAVYILIIGIGLNLVFGASLYMFLIPAGFMYGTNFFRSKKFIIEIMRRGLKKVGYNDEIEEISDHKIMEVFINGSS